jgi:pilus assembly protein CpaB
MARRVILIIIALLVSGGAIFLAMQWFGGGPAHQTAQTGPAPTPPPTVRVMVAKTTMYSGQFVRPDSITWQTWPSGPLPDSYLVEGKARLGDLVGAVVRSRLAQGQPVTLDQVVRPGDRGFLAAVLTPGDRAITVNVNASSGVSGFVFPGDRVDMLLTMTLTSTDKDSETPNRHVTETILHNVRIVGMDQSFTDGRKDDKADLSIPKTATFEVTPKQAEIISVAGDLGSLSLSLRSLALPGEGGAPDRVTKTWDIEATHLPVTTRKPAPLTVNVVRGASDSVVPLGGSTQGAR